MKQNTIKTNLFASLMTISGAALPASAAQTLHVNVPFAFVVNGAKMDAGNYNITPADNGVVTIAGSKTAVMVLTVPSDYAKNTGLSFTSSNNDSVLTSIKLGDSIAREIPVHQISEHKASLVSAR